MVALPGDTEDASVIRPRPVLTYVGSEAWQLQATSDDRRVTEAYADSPSYLPGDTLRLAVSTDRPTYAVSIWRIGARMRLMYRSGLLPGILQTRVAVDPATKTVRAVWQWTYSLTVPPEWSSGVYLAKVSGSSGAQAYVPFVVRSTRASTFLFVSNHMNAEAYNTWGGSSLYMTTLGSPGPGATYAFGVSLDRPFVEEKGAGQVLMLEAPFIEWLELNGYDVTYTTDYDLAYRPYAQPLPRAVIFSGHSEYWTGTLREWLERHVVERGEMGLGMFAADAGYWRVRFDAASSGDSGPRSFRLYKDARLDPTIPDRCPGGYTRDASAFRAYPCGLLERRNLPEQALLGIQYGAIVPGYHPYVLADGLPKWLLAGTGLSGGDRIGDVVGGEVDYVDATFACSPAVVRVARNSRLEGLAGTVVKAAAVLREFPSRGRVFASGTFWWGWGLEPSFAAAHDVPAGFVRLTGNLLAWLAGA